MPDISTARRELLAIRNKVCTCNTRTEVDYMHDEGCPEIRLINALRALEEKNVVSSYQKGL